VLVSQVSTGKAGGVTSEVAALSEREQAIIEFENTWFTLDEDKYDAIRARFACSLEEYTHELNRVIDHPGALEFSPLVVRRLRRNRARRRRARLEGSADVSSSERGNQA
jgi:CHAD domain-containing protein